MPTITDPTTTPDPELSHGAEYIGRVRTGGGGFVNAIDEPVIIQPADILVKIPDGPWFARYQRIAPIDAQEPAAAETASEPAAEEAKEEAPAAEENPTEEGNPIEEETQVPTEQ